MTTRWKSQIDLLALDIISPATKLRKMGEEVSVIGGKARKAQLESFLLQLRPSNPFPTWFFMWS